MLAQVGAFVGPGIVQGYVGNALEPMLFGAALNMTPLAILARDGPTLLATHSLPAARLPTAAVSCCFFAQERNGICWTKITVPRPTPSAFARGRRRW